MNEAMTLFWIAVIGGSPLWAFLLIWKVLP